MCFFTADVDCCCGMELRTGSLVIGYVNLVVNIILILWTILVWLILAEEVRYDVEGIVFAPFLLLYTVYLIMYILNLFFNILLIRGLRKYRTGYIKAYIVYTTIFIWVYICEFFLKFNYFGAVFNIYIFISSVISFLIIVGSSYSLLIITSYHAKENFDNRDVDPDDV